jgi:formylglycine-generating enzyme required for sulfatase activity
MSPAKKKPIKEMVTAHAGNFLMGSNTDKWLQPIHKVNLDGFLIDIVPIMQKEYQEIIGNNPSEFIDNPSNPVESVTWYDAILFCNKRSEIEGLAKVYKHGNITKRANGQCSLIDDIQCDYTKNGYRLPTEAEWEYACRAGTTTVYFWGDSDILIDDYSWWSHNSNNKTHPVGEKKPNHWGLYDMVGNVSQWCNDWYGEDYYSRSPELNPIGPSNGECRCARGGSFYTQFRIKMSSAERFFFEKPENYYHGLGIRCVRREN